ncbi:hypothetical protein CPPEL_07020 [Corynebacterium pseudopelargi]|uniref:GmrSD restriction endonucleases C-terminal domain-containing protein n=1 Tax=Corynebacterium pseudopelargi TaxID=2080757 RepID=A0A3G6J047_9CORY|nr:HNH endonuclease family protein [Corynebacterium pseudopelargi]AZA09514.1 hypothetical protein CPPEL_07020 [Corynebacterium pseudopelargi]
MLLLVPTVLLAGLSLPPLERLDPAINQIPQVAMRTKVQGYQREQFGHGWARAPKASCDTRQRLLAEQLFDVHQDPSCALRSGWGEDPYSGRRIGVGFEGVEAIELDHVFPLAAAWDLGAATWSQQQRENFANDPLNLVIASRHANQEKSDALPASWLPPKRRARCWYVNRLAAVAARYGLALPRADVAVMRRQCLLR